MIIDPLGVFQLQPDTSVGPVDSQPAAEQPDRFRLPVVKDAVEEVVAAELGVIPDAHVPAGIEVQALDAH